MNGHDLRLGWRPSYGRGRWPYAVLDVLLVSLITLCSIVETRLNRVDAVSPSPAKPAWGLGQDWLLVARDDRRNPPGEERPGRPGPGGRTSRADTIMWLHLPHDAGKATLVSLPLNAYVRTAGHDPVSFSAALAQGGPASLVRTFETATRVSVERYAEVDLGSLGALVDLVGGVKLCTGRRTRAETTTERSADCPNLRGRQALRYLRARGTGNGDLDRAVRQRRLIAALIEKATSPGVLFNPLRGISLAMDGARAVTIDENGHLYDLVRLALTLRRGGGLVTAAVPTVNGGTVPGAGRVVTWDPQTMGGLISALVTDGPLPKGLITE